MEDVRAAGQSLAMPARLRAVFARRGPILVAEAGSEVVLEAGTCRLFEAAISLRGPGEAWTFELSASGDEMVVAEAERHRVILARLIDRDPNEKVIVRADRVDFPTSAVTPKHGHKGPGIRRLIDVRLNNVSQLAGFTKRDDLAFFLRKICGIEYLHEPLLAPTQEMLDAFKKKKGSWQDYERAFLDLMADRRVEEQLDRNLFEAPTVLLCSEPTAEHCHRRLVVEYLLRKWDNVVGKHL